MCEAPAVVMPADQSKKHVILQVCRGWLGICSLRVLLHWPWCWAVPPDAGMEHLQMFAVHQAVLRQHIAQYAQALGRN